MKSKDDIWRYLKYYKQAFMPPKKKTPVCMYKLYVTNQLLNNIAFVKMVLDGRKMLLLKKATKCALDFPKVSDMIITNILTVPSTDSKVPLSYGKYNSELTNM